MQAGHEASNPNFCRQCGVYSARSAISRGRCGPTTHCRRDSHGQADGGPFNPLTDGEPSLNQARLYYPDVQVLGDPTDNDLLVKRRPCMVVEVTSDSTESIDRREKLRAYRGVASLNLYLIVAEDRREVTVHRRDSAGSWQTQRVYDQAAIDVDGV